MPRSAYERLPPTGPRDASQLARVINDLRDGRMDVLGEVEISAAADETVITDSSFSPLTLIVAMVPLDAASVGLEWWIKSRTKGSITLGHPADGANDRSYAWVALG